MMELSPHQDDLDNQSLTAKNFPGFYRMLMGMRFPLDVADPQSVARLAAKLQHVKVDVLINNAGVTGGDFESFEKVDLEAWNEAFNINTIGPFLLTTALMWLTAPPHRMSSSMRMSARASFIM